MRLRDSAEEAALLMADGSQLLPPVDVWGLAELLGARVVEREMPGDGRLMEKRGSAEIHISSRSGPARRRFTIAHELGHFWVLQNGLDGKSPSRLEEEHFCNFFAAALLIPRDWVERSVEDGEEEGLSQLSRMARRAQTSISAMLIRLRDVAGWRSTLLRYRRDDYDWHFASCTASQPSLVERLSSARETTVALSAAAGRHGTFRAFLPVSIDEKLVSCWAELLVGRHTAVALTKLRYEGERLPRGWDQFSTITIPPTPDEGFCQFCRNSEQTWRLWSLTREARAPDHNLDRLPSFQAHECRWVAKQAGES